GLHRRRPPDRERKAPRRPRVAGGSHLCRQRCLRLRPFEEQGIQPGAGRPLLHRGRRGRIRLGQPRLRLDRPARRGRHGARRVVAAPAVAPPAAMIGVYIHIPYCRTICPYCDFVKRRISGDVPDPFIAALCREIAEFSGPDRACSVFFGGGTPSLVRPESLETVLDALRRRFRLEAPEITLEANPDDITPDLVAAWRVLGVNRVSLGVQSFDDRVLRYLGRRHDAERARRACAVVAERFDNWSMDLIFGARPADAFEDTLRQCVALAPPHVSAYGLTYEPGTPFGRRADEAIDDEAYLCAFWTASERLEGYERYEISNFARPGYRCR